MRSEDNRLVASRTGGVRQTGVDIAVANTGTIGGNLTVVSNTDAFWAEAEAWTEE